MSSSSVAPCASLASSSSAWRSSGLRRRFPGDFPIGDSSPSLPPLHLLITFGERRLRLVQCVGHPLIGRRNRPPRTCLRDLLQEPPPLRFPDDHLPVDTTAHRLINHALVTLRPLSTLP